MIPLIQMTTEQLNSYRQIRGHYTGMEFVFCSPGGYFAFYGDFAIPENGAVGLTSLLVVHSGEHHPGEIDEALKDWRRRIIAGCWCIDRQSGDELAATGDDFELMLRSERTPNDTIATHLLLIYGKPDVYLHEYFNSDFHLRTPRSPEAPTAPPPPPKPVEIGQAEVLSVNELAQRLRGLPLIAFTGAGISVASGIPSLTGPGSLQEQFPFDQHRFPGKVADWMIDRPRDTALILGRFHCGFITAIPNAAHRVLARLEERGMLKHIITGNFDLLHERAGSRNVHINTYEFGADGKGLAWIREARAALVVGVATVVDQAWNRLPAPSSTPVAANISPPSNQSTRTPACSSLSDSSITC